MLQFILLLCVFLCVYGITLILYIGEYMYFAVDVI